MNLNGAAVNYEVYNFRDYPPPPPDAPGLSVYVLMRLAHISVALALRVRRAATRAI